MIYKFRSEAAGDLIMMGPDGDRVLEIIGKPPAPRGIIESEAIPAAIEALERAIGEEARAQPADAAPREDEEDDAGRGAAAVRLRQRAWPMLEMMRRSLAEQKDIVWGV